MRNDSARSSRLPRPTAHIARLATAALVACASTTPNSASGPGARDDGIVGPGDARVARPTPSDGPVVGSGSLQVQTNPSTDLGLDAFTPNGRIQPHGRPTTYYFEYGPTTSYGSRTAEQPLPPKLTAHYLESWETGLAGWFGGMSGKYLSQIASGGAQGGFVRYTENPEQDVNHYDGIGPNELVQYSYAGGYEAYDEDGGGIRSAWFGGGLPDFRGAKISAFMRGASWQPNGAECTFWLQSTPDPTSEFDATARWTNWAYTGQMLTDALLGGDWQRVEYRLANDTRLWTYAGNYVESGRSDYVYFPIDRALANVNGDYFHMLVFVDLDAPPKGAIDIDELHITYRNRSVLQKSNGGLLVSAPPGSDDPTTLTDGWRNGAGKTWRSAKSPSGPVEITYSLATPVTIEAVQIHQNPEWPSQDIEVLVSQDGVSFSSVTTGVLPPTTTLGPNYAFFLDRTLSAKARFVKIRILSGYNADYWGLGEIEVFGSGAVMETDDDWYEVNTDITGLTPGATYHYRLVATAEGETVHGADMTFTVPAVAMPEVRTAGTPRQLAGTAKVEARVNPLGVATTYYVDYGETTDYGMQTPEAYAGLQITPRTVLATLSGLVPGKTYHYRFVAKNAKGTTLGSDATFVAQ